ncbi:sulfotransferase family 2 domain-containing protein [Nocardioides daejeonensis]|uniref:sulfotransferase family 2 domain-containing protein n=1 Tax=Nocardioides daejeonensis TaxID=1046556 RepID=UPI000D74695B|nr:sulfotransferase family 2 domain-containing protein [Nocardioides daejeonensis]
MRVSDSRRVLFVHVPKTGGSTIDLMFDREVGDTRRVDGRARHAPLGRLLAAEPQLADYWIFGFVRNPWARMVSWWSMVNKVFTAYEAGEPKAVKKVETYPDAWLPEGEFAHDFDAFVLEGTAKIAKVGRPQVHTLNAKERSADFVGTIENFHDDANRVRERLGLTPLDKLPRRNKSSHGAYQDYYNEVTRRKVAEVYAEDIEAFGYEF